MAAKMPHVCDFRAAVSLVKEKRGTQLSNGQMLGMVASMMSAAGDTKASVCVGRARDLCVGDLSTMSRFECILFVEELLRQDGIVVLSPRREHDQKMLRMASERKHADMTIEVWHPTDTTRTFGANKSVLYQTAYFAAMIDAEATNTEWDGVYRIRMKPSVFEFVLEYIYTGSFTIAVAPEPDMLASIAVAADMLQLPLLIAACADFVCPTSALVVLRAAARAETPAMGMLVERCASAIVLGASCAHDLDPRAFVADGVLPLHAVYAIAAQAVLAMSRFSPEETRAMIGRVWPAVQARFDGTSLCDLQASLLEDSLLEASLGLSGARRPRLLGPYSKTFTLDLDRASADHHHDTIDHIMVDVTMGEQCVHLLVKKKLRRDCIEIEGHLYALGDTDLDYVSALRASPQLIVIRTEAGTAYTDIHFAPYCCTSFSIPVEELEDSSSEGKQRPLRFTVEVDPLFAFVTAVAVCTLQRDTAEIVKRFESSTLTWILSSSKSAYDPIHALRALANRVEQSGWDDRDMIAGDLAPKLSDVPVGQLLDILKQAPALSRLGNFSKLLWSRTVATTSADALVGTLASYMELVCSARETVLTQEMRQTTTGARPDPDDAADDAAGNEGEPKTKIARLV